MNFGRRIHALSGIIAAQTLAVGAPTRSTKDEDVPVELKSLPKSYYDPPVAKRPDMLPDLICIIASKTTWDAPMIRAKKGFSEKAFPNQPFYEQFPKKNKRR